MSTSLAFPGYNFSLARAHAERFIGSVRRELLNNFIIFSYGQLFRLIKKYVFYYNTMRPHQGIDQQTPEGYIPQTKGKIVKVPVLGGLKFLFK